MAEIKKIYDDAAMTNQVYPQTHERAVVDNNGTTAETKFGLLQEAYSALTQSDIVVVADHTAVSSPQANTIYREQGTTTYSDWMYYDSSWKKMAEYDNAIDDVPTEDSDNLVKSGGIYDATPSNVGTGNEADFEISDEYKNVLCVFNNGHIKTMNFDSETDTPIKGTKTDDADLKISDESGNVLCVFEDGHIRTKNFNSQVFAKMPANGYENFLYDVNTYIPSDNTSQTLQDGIELQKDRGIIVFPDNYDEGGKAVRLIIANQGSSGRVLSSDTMPHNCCPFADLMLAEGYAVLQINGTPGYTDGIATYGASGNPDYLKSIVKAYEYVVQKYNIRRDGVLLAGFSQGTLKCWQIAANKTLPVIACVMFGPCLDLWKLMYPYTTPSQRQFICQRFGFVEKEANEYVLEYFGSIYQQGDIVTAPSSYTSAGYKANDYELAYILNNYELWKGYDPICWGTTKNIIGKQFSVVNWVTTEDPEEDAIYADVGIVVPCPMKLFVGLADVTTTPKLTRWYKGMADNSGMKLDVRYYADGDHHFTSSYPTISVQTKYGGTITTNLPSWEGMLYLERLDY